MANVSYRDFLLAKLKYNRLLNFRCVNKKEIVIGFVVGIIANTIGTLVYIALFSNFSVVSF